MFYLLFFLGLISSAASVNAWQDADRIISVYNNQGSVGLVQFVNKQNHYSGDEFKVQAWSTKIINVTGRHDINRIAFKTQGRHDCYNANLYHVNYWTDNYVYKDVPVLYLNVNFYPDRAYYNRLSAGAPFNTGNDKWLEFDYDRCRLD
jgi:hypothetical protein